MPVRNIVRGQRVDEAKVQRARELRRHMTPAERTLWQALRRRQLNGLHFRRQQVISGFIADFYCHGKGLVIEVDGEAHAGQEHYDAERGQVLASLGLRELRFTNDEVVNNLGEVLRRIEDACGEPNPPTRAISRSEMADFPEREGG